jgi:membrane protease YdiL (CAAX protease family)
MSKWKLRMPAMYENIPLGGYMPKAGVALPIALLLYLIYSVIGSIPTMVQAFVFLIPRVAAGQDPFTLIGEMLADPAIILVALFMTGLAIPVTIFYIRRIEKRPLRTIGLSRERIVRRYAAGVGLGAVLVGLAALPDLLAGPISWKGFTAIVPVYLAAFIIQGASEEVLFRGFLLSAISRRIGIFWAAVLSSALFAVMHIATLEGLLDFLVIFLIGFMLAMITVRTGSLWAACGLHSAWNFVSGLLFTVNAGGMKVDYSVVTVGDPAAAAPEFGFFGNPSYLIAIALFAALSAAVVFAGRGRLAVRRPESERVLAIARHIAKRTLPEGHMAYAERISATVEQDNAKAAALLCLVMERGVSPQALADAGIGRMAGLAAMALMRRPGEDEESRRARAMGDPVAAAVYKAQEQYAADYAARQQAEQQSREYAWAHYMAAWQGQAYMQQPVQPYAQWQLQQKARYMSPSQAEWQARQDAERDAYVRRYAEATRAQPGGDGHNTPH